MIKILHNNRCSKSREGLKLLIDNDLIHEIVDYLNHPLSIEEINSLIKKIGVTPLELVRKNESIWKENYKGKVLTDLEIITALHENPKLIERPIFIKGDKAVIGRPAERLNEIL